MNDNLSMRYAIALLDVAIENNQVLEYLKQISELLNIFCNNKDLKILLADYGLNNEEKKETITTIFKNNVNQYILNFMYIIIDNNRGKYYVDIFKEFIKRAQNYLHIVNGICYSTISLSKEDLNNITEKVSKLLNKKVVLTNRIDSSLIGGFKVEVEDKIIDESIKKRLLDLKKSIKIKKGAD